MNAASAAKYLCITTVCALIYLRFTFGGSSSPAEWCILIEIITDLALDITNNPHWNHNTTFTKEPNPTQSPSPLLNPPSEPFTTVLPTNVQLHLPRHGYINSYIDNLIGVCLYRGENAICTTKAMILTLFLVVRPSNSSTPPILHKYLLSITKLLAKDQQT